MAVYPPRGSTPWDLTLKSYIDEANQPFVDDLAAHESATTGVHGIPNTANLARRDSTNTFTAEQTISTTGRALRLVRPNAGEDRKTWSLYGTAPTGNLRLEPMNDDGSPGPAASNFYFNRDGSFGHGGIAEFTGTGNPNGVVAAQIGSVFRNTEAGGWNGARVWRKDSGQGTANGWVVESGDTGWRDITTLLVAGTTATTLRIKRLPGRLVLHGHEVTNSSVGSIMLTTNLAAAWGGPTLRANYVVSANGGMANNDTMRVYMTSAGQLYLGACTNASFQLYMDVDRPWPTSLIGTPA